jgi:hypothetical protein
MVLIGIIKLSYIKYKHLLALAQCIWPATFQIRNIILIKKNLSDKVYEFLVHLVLFKGFFFLIIKKKRKKKGVFYTTQS